MSESISKISHEPKQKKYHYFLSIRDRFSQIQKIIILEELLGSRIYVCLKQITIELILTFICIVLKLNKILHQEYDILKLII